MERANIKVSVVYILTGVILLLMIYLGLFIYKSYNSGEDIEINDESVSPSLPEVDSSCTFDMTMSEFNDITNNTDICSTLNKINITNIIIDEQLLETTIYYSNNGDDTNTGIYVNGAKIAEVANNLETHKLGVFDQMLFMTTVNDESASFEVFDKNMAIIYSLTDALNSLQIEDPAFMSLATMNSNLDVVLSIQYIDGNSFSFTNGQILFNSTTKMTCTTGELSGSSYIITYEGTTFSTPTYTAEVICE